jgi:hypothetical protein
LENRLQAPWNDARKFKLLKQWMFLDLKISVPELKLDEEAAFQALPFQQPVNSVDAFQN